MAKRCCTGICSAGNAMSDCSSLAAPAPAAAAASCSSSASRRRDQQELEPCWSSSNPHRKRGGHVHGGTHPGTRSNLPTRQAARRSQLTAGAG